MADFRHLARMTDEQGMLQFSQLDQPVPASGYTLDDNARGLMVALRMGTYAYPYARAYANYMLKAQTSDGIWANLLIDGSYHHGLDSEDSLGRAIWACSLGRSSDWPDISTACTSMLERSLPRAETLSSPRAVAYFLIALCQTDMPGWTNQQQNQIITRYTQYLTGLYRKNQSKSWQWFENYMTYCNGILPQAMFNVYMVNGDKKALRIGHEALNFLCQTLFRQGYLNIIGNQGWYHKGCAIPLFDQQPVDASSIALACLDAYKAIGRSEYLELATLAHRWYYGLNCHGLSLYNEVTGGCYDALTEKGVNLNQGAEAVLSLLITELSLERSLIIPAPATELI
ncbi:MAG TPA: hypothetical protein DER33_05610 [Syntrophomonas sp.]|nr:hypothetical protein [Syntrophomonas sp.]HCF71056.1 hypothetical protein [Syntrophomonas sp.]